AGVLGADEAHRALLQATVEVARAIFGAKAASVFLLDEEADELVFGAVAGEGGGGLVRTRVPAGAALAGRGQRGLGPPRGRAARGRRPELGHALAALGRRVDRLRPEEHDGRPAA